MESIYQSEYDEAYYQSDIDSAYLMANTWHRRNVIANRVAMTIWIGDMSMVLIKGIRNKAIRRKYNLSSNSSPKHDYMIMYDPVTEGVRFTYVVKF
ncbi:MAG: hypothetical protein C0594_12890 [Marinilabiliales bacterium]|nr:MAG: hypothetical protein C0594_12890 [Marinilabiliales bacterium]